MLVGFISLALTVGQESFSKICVPSPWVNIMHQCNNATITDEIKAIDYGTCKAVSYIEIPYVFNYVILLPIRCKGLRTLSEESQSSVFLFLHHKEVSDPNFLVPANIAMSLFLSDHFHDVFKL